MTKCHKIITARQPVPGCSEQPLTGLDVIHAADGLTLALVYAAPIDVRMLIDNLQQTLDTNPYFSGRLFGLGSTLPLAIPNNEGVLFSHVMCKERLPTFNLERPLKPYISRFVDTIDTTDFDHRTPLLQIRLTNFVDGSILGISLSHAFCDATSMLFFLRDWARSLIRHEAPSPCWNRREIQLLALGNGEHPPRDGSVIEWESMPPTGNDAMETELFHMGAPLLERLYEKYGTHDAMLTQQDIATAFLFLLIVGCQHGSPESTSLTITCDIRRKLELPTNYLGNAAVSRHLEVSAAQLEVATIGSFAKQIRRIQWEITAEGLRRELAFWHKRMADGSAQRFMPLANYLTLRGGVLIEDMANFDFYDLDFGAGKPLWIDTPAPAGAVARSVLILPAPRDRGGIDIHISLPPEELKVLRRSTLNIS